MLHRWAAVTHTRPSYTLPTKLTTSTGLFLWRIILYIEEVNGETEGVVEATFPGASCKLAIGPGGKVNGFKIVNFFTYDVALPLRFLEKFKV